MRAVHMLAICAMATIGSAASAQEVDWKKVDLLGAGGTANRRHNANRKHVNSTHDDLLVG